MEVRRPRSGRLPFFGFLVVNKRTRVVVASGWGKVENLLLVFHFSMAAKPGCGNVEISRLLRDFQGTVEGVGKLVLLFHAFHGPGISTAQTPIYCNRVGSEILHCRSSRDFAAFTFRAHSVSLIAIAFSSNCDKLVPGLRYCSTRSNDFSFSNGVR